MVYKKLHKHIAKHAKRVHAHVQDHGHKWLSILGIALIIILIYPYFSNAQTPETCTNGGVNFPTCDQCAEGYVLDESDQCVEDTQEPETCTNGAVNPSDCDECAEGYFLNGSQQCVEGILIPGCMDEGSMNYDPLATVDDGSCIPLTVETIQLTGTVQYSPATSTTGSVVATVTGFSTTGVTVTSAG